MLYIPADSPGMLQHAPVFGCDSILMDLEDAIAYTEKDSARRMAVWFLKEFDFKELFVSVRTNGADTKFFEDDIEAVIPCRPGAVRLPKCNSEEDIRYADEKISAVEMKNGMEIGTVKLRLAAGYGADAWRAGLHRRYGNTEDAGGTRVILRARTHSRRRPRRGSRFIRYRLDGPQ